MKCSLQWPQTVRGKHERARQKWLHLKRGADKRGRKCSHQGEYLLIHLRRGGRLLIASVWLWVEGPGRVLKILPATLLLPHRLSFISLNPRFYNVRQDCHEVVSPVLQQWNLNRLNLRDASWWEMTYSLHSVHAMGRLSTHGAQTPTKGILKKY